VWIAGEDKKIIITPEYFNKSIFTSQKYMPKIGHTTRTKYEFKWIGYNTVYSEKFTFQLYIKPQT